MIVKREHVDTLKREHEVFLKKLMNRRFRFHIFFELVVGNRYFGLPIDLVVLCTKLDAVGLDGKNGEGFLFDPIPKSAVHITWIASYFSSNIIFFEIFKSWYAFLKQLFPFYSFARLQVKIDGFADGLCIPCCLLYTSPSPRDS